MIHGSAQFRVAPGGLHMLHLGRCRRKMSLLRRRFLSRSWARIHSAVSAVVADPILGAIDDRLVVNVVNDGTFTLVTERL